MTDPIHTPQSAADFLRISVEHFHRLCTTGQIRAGGTGRSRRVLESELIRWARGEKINSRPTNPAKGATHPAINF